MKETQQTETEKWAPVVSKSKGTYAARLPFRDVVGQGSSEKEAISTLVASYMDLVRKGSIDPSQPSKPGAPPLQHVLNLLGEQLSRAVAGRYTDWHDHVLDEANVEAAINNCTTAGGAWLDNPVFRRRSEVICGLATAIAAIARIKEL